MSAEDDDQLKRYREQIDALDAQILGLMNERIGAAQSIAAIKLASNRQALKEPAYYRPEREAQVLRRLKELNTSSAGLLDGADVEALFREIMSITRGSEAGLSAALLGPTGTFTEAAALQHFGSAVQLEHFSTIDEIFRAAETGQTNFAVVPIENSTEGGVNATLDRLGNTSLLICGEIFLKIHHNLITHADAFEGVHKVVAHPQALGQCRNWLNRNLPGVAQAPCSSNAEAVRLAAEDKSIAGIAADVAAQQYGVPILVGNIEDVPGNTTRFLVLSDRQTPASGDDKTSLLLSGRNRPGSLFHLLKPLVDSGVDMTKIESRPSKSGLWEYVFYVDMHGHQDDPAVAAALKEIKMEAGLYKLLGSYPASV